MKQADEGIGRITRSKAQARRAYDRISSWYDLLAGSSERRYKRLCLQHLAVAPGERVLEIGVGTGECSRELARGVGPDGNVDGVDISGGMLAVASRRLARAGLVQRTRFAQADACHLPYAGEGFDAVFSSFTLELFDIPEIADVLNECRRVLKPGGRLCIVSMTKDEHPGLMSRLYVWFHRRFPNVVDCRPIHVAQSIREAGFAIVESQTLSMWGMPVAIVLAVKA
jgi:ubiquinone/menaquinone biosynthesis C-methylase UbiE